MKKEINRVIDKFLEKIRRTEYFPKIEFIILYGSYLGDYHYDDSDIDICIYIQENVRNLAEIRLNILKKFEDKFDIQIFQLLPIYIQIEVLKGKVLYMRDENMIYEIAYETIEEYEELAPFYKDYINR